MSGREQESLLGRDPETAAQSEEEEIAERSLFVFRLGSSLYAVPPTAVDHVTEQLQPVRVPTAARHILGVVHLRGSIVPIVEISDALGLSRDENAPQNKGELTGRLVVLKTKSGRFGCEASEVLGLRRIRENEIRTVDGAVDEDQNLLVGQFDVDEGVVNILSAENLYQALADSNPG